MIPSLLGFASVYVSSFEDKSHLKGSWRVWGSGPTSDRVTAIAPVALPAANQFPPYLPYTHRNFFFHGTIIPPEANHTYLGNAFEHCLLNASRAPGDYLEQRSAEECGAFCGVAAGDCQPLCSGHGMCSFSESVQESVYTCDSNFDNQAGLPSCSYSGVYTQTTAVSLAGAAAQPFNGTIILTPPTSNTSGAAQCSAHLPLPFHRQPWPV
ncbi:unnamed protein product [Closterium sp. NIES-65]|nr:unnamed protein product [Closterium sp. NIES-65]CAI6000655.1 unnamed protein product [Closterium sp. NIES-65]